MERQDREDSYDFEAWFKLHESNSTARHFAFKVVVNDTPEGREWHAVMDMGGLLATPDRQPARMHLQDYLGRISDDQNQA